MDLPTKQRGATSVMNLYLIQFGGSRTDSIFEAHDVRVAFGDTLQDAVASLADKVRSSLKAAHVDGFAEVELREAEDLPGRQLFLVETGVNGPAMFEQHAYEFVWAESARDAQLQAGKPTSAHHVDTVFNVSRAARAKGWAVKGRADDGSPYIPVQQAHYRRV